MTTVSICRTLLGAKKTPMLRNSRRKGTVTVIASVRSRGLKEEYTMLKLTPGATGEEVKKAYRRLALQYHPDVYKGNGGMQFEKINEAYQSIMSNLAQAEEHKQKYSESGDEINNSYVEEDKWEEWIGWDGGDEINNSYVEEDEWEEWMGWEGASTSRDYSNHINTF